MRNAVIKVAVFSCAFAALSTSSAAALSVNDFALTDDPFRLTGQRSTIAPPTEEKEPKTSSEDNQPTKGEAKPEPVQHVVGNGETLTAIGEKYNAPWKRLFDKNTTISDPNLLNIGDVITVPTESEQLAERPLPESQPIFTTSQVGVSTAVTNPVTNRGSSAGNTYTPGYCTWYAKNRRPDLPNRLGNAASWVSSAAAQGIPTGSAPQVGAIGQQGNHVVYVETVNGDGTVTVSEMNYSGLFVISSRTVAAGNFRYIY